MLLYPFEVTVAEGNEVEGGYVRLAHGQQYTLVLRNLDYNLKCDAEVVIDGKSVGNFRIDRGNTVRLERPADDNGRFTFYSVGTTDAAQAGQANIDEYLRGLVEVIFRPEKYVPPKAVNPRSSNYYAGELESCTLRSFGAAQNATMSSAGITGLSGKSNQNFTTVQELDYDNARVARLYLRLVADGPREMKPSKCCRSSPVPNPL